MGRFLCVLSLAAFVGCGPSSDGRSRPTSETGDSLPAHRLVIVGLDGATWDVIDPMIEAGELPNLGGLIARGARADLVCLPPLNSAAAWTTIATGRFPRTHQILDHAYPYVPGPKRRIDATLRRSPALWSIAGHYGRTVGVVGYYASHPAERVNGFLVTDRAAEKVRGAIYPPDLSVELEPVLEPLDDPKERARLRQAVLGWKFDMTTLSRPDDPYFHATEVVKGRVDQRILDDEYFRRATLHLLERPTDLMVTYLRLIDHVSHSTWRYFEPTAFSEPPTAHDRELLGTWFRQPTGRPTASSASSSSGWTIGPTC